MKKFVQHFAFQYICVLIIIKKKNKFMKAIIENNKTYKYVSTKGAFYVCEDMNGKAKMFEASKVELVEIESMLKAKNYSCSRSSDEKRAEKMMVTAHRTPLTAQEKEDLRIEMEKAKWGSKSW